MHNIPHHSLVKVGLVTGTVSLQGTVIHVVLFMFHPTAANHINQPTNQHRRTNTADPLLHKPTPSHTHTRSRTLAAAVLLLFFFPFLFLLVLNIVPASIKHHQTAHAGKTALWALEGKTQRLPRLPAFVESAVGQICRRAGNESAGGVESVDDLQREGGPS